MRLRDQLCNQTAIIGECLLYLCHFMDYACPKYISRILIRWISKQLEEVKQPTDLSLNFLGCHRL